MWRAWFLVILLAAACQRSGRNSGMQNMPMRGMPMMQEMQMQGQQMEGGPMDGQEMGGMMVCPHMQGGSAEDLPEEEPAGYDEKTFQEGKELFLNSCSSCHGADARGIPGVGKNLWENPFIQSHTDKELLRFLQEGRPADDPLNTTGIAMPPRGGNPRLTDEDLKKIIAFLRSLNNAYDPKVPKPDGKK